MFICRNVFHGEDFGYKLGNYGKTTDIVNNRIYRNTEEILKKILTG
jgi:hypothetical protein